MSENNLYKEVTSEKILYPVLPLKDSVIMPTIVMPVLVGRDLSVKAVEHAVDHTDKMIVVLSQKDSDNENPKAQDLYRTGTVCHIIQVFKLPDGNMRILLEGRFRIKIQRFYTRDGIRLAHTIISNKDLKKLDTTTLAFIRSVKTVFQQYLKLNASLPEELFDTIKDRENPLELLYFIASNVHLHNQTKQEIYEEDDVSNSIIMLFEKLKTEVKILELEKNINARVRDRLDKLQKEFFLNEQLKIIHQELGNLPEEKSEYLSFKEKIEKLNLNEEAKAKAEEELKKIARIPVHSQEYTVVYNYLSAILELPWENAIQKDVNIPEAEKILEEDHYGLKKVKERIVEYLAVMKLAKKVKGQIICFVGPPGVGKTSLGKSIARALGREFVRLSLGGVRDEAEIRGHRRTYIGSMPGVIMQSIKKAKVRNPLILMDEVDKMSMDFRGDPAAALLEVLDPEQNNTFRDHYLDFGYDLSDVLFITTANTVESIPRPLLDRMELIHLPGYTAFEKKHIALRHLVPRILKELNIREFYHLTFADSAIERIINEYTREAGVRNLDRDISKIIRKTAREYLTGEIKGNHSITGEIKGNHSISGEEIEKYLGVPRQLYPEISREDSVGIVSGLAWTASGGEILEIEVLRMRGDGKLKLTGKLGDVMKESAEAALSYARFNAEKFAINPEIFKNSDLHLHVPEGATPKDGPSAGITIATAMISALSDRKVRWDFAMTGEITITGKVLPIGGLEEKLIAAKRAGINNVIIPKKNEPRLTEINREILENMNIISVQHIEEVIGKVIRD